MSRTTIASWLKTQLYGILAITIVMAIVIGALELYKSIAPSFISSGNIDIINLGNGGGTGVFVVWLVFVLIFTLINAIIYTSRHPKRSKRA